MRRSFAVLLCVSLLIVAGFLPQAKAEEAGAKPGLMTYIPEDAFFAFEADVNKLQAICSSIPAKFAIRFLAREFRLGQQNFGRELMSKMLSLRWTGRLIVTLMPPSDGMLVAARIDGDAAESLEAVFKDSPIASAGNDIPGHRVYTLPFRWSRKLFVSSKEDVIVVSNSLRAVATFIGNIGGEKKPDFLNIIE